MNRNDQPAAPFATESRLHWLNRRGIGALD